MAEYTARNGRIVGMLDIMLPYWGDPGYLRAAVDSIFDQDDPRWHLTIIDDKYPDMSVANHFSGLDDPRIDFIRNDENLGVKGNFQRSLDLASAEYVMFMGSDDLLRPDFVSTALDSFERFPEAEFVQAGVEVIDAKGVSYSPLADQIKRRIRPRSERAVLIGGEKLAASLLYGNWLYWPSLVFRTSSIKRYSFQDYSIILDLGITLDLIADGARLAVVPDIVFMYRRHQESASSSTLLGGERFAEERSFFASQSVRFTEIGWHHAARAARLHATSRAHAASLLPKALAGRSASAFGVLMRHILSSE